VSKKKDETKMNTHYTLEQYKMISLIKIYKSYPEVDGKYRFGIKTPSEDTRYHAIWAKDEQSAWEKSYKQYIEQKDSVHFAIQYYRQRRG
jgi:hypothetical protein